LSYYEIVHLLTLGLVVLCIHLVYIIVRNLRLRIQSLEAKNKFKGSGWQERGWQPRVFQPDDELLEGVDYKRPETTPNPRKNLFKRKIKDAPKVDNVTKTQAAKAVQSSKGS